jgi:hypothetical protein
MSKRVIVVVLACVALAAPALVALAASPRISTEETFTVTEETYYNQ